MARTKQVSHQSGKGKRVATFTYTGESPKKKTKAVPAKKRNKLAEVSTNKLVPSNVAKSTYDYEGKA